MVTCRIFLAVFILLYGLNGVKDYGFSLSDLWQSQVNRQP